MKRDSLARPLIVPALFVFFVADGRKKDGHKKRKK